MQEFDAPPNQSQAEILTPPITVAYFNHKEDNRPKLRALTWPQLCESLKDHKKRQAKDGPLFSAAAYPKGKTRANQNVTFVTAAVFDFDGTATIEEIRNFTFGFDCIIYSTFSHGEKGERYRVVLRLARPIPAANWPDVWERANRFLFEGKADHAAKDAARLHYLPACPPERANEAHAEVLEGEPLDPDTLPVLPAQQGAPRPAPTAPLSLDDERIIEKARGAKNSAKFCQLHDSGDAGGYHSGSEADEALCCLIAFYTRDAAQIERIWQGSALWREKSDKRPDYVERTISKALEIVSTQYDPARRITGMMNGHAPMQPTTPPAKNLTPQIEIAPVTVAEKLPVADRELVLHCLDGEEAGDAELVEHLYNGRVLFDHSDKQWYLWRGHNYIADRTGIVRRLVVAQLANQYLHHAAELTREAEAEGEAGAHKRGIADRLIKRAKQLRNLKRVKNILELAQSWLGIEGSEWDSKPHLLAVKNGVLDLRTGALRAGRPEDLIRTAAPVEWKGLDAPAPRFEQFILEIMAGDIDTAAFLQRLLGYGIYGEVLEHILPILWGAGRNGKDTLLEILGYVLGNYASAVSSDVLIADKRNRAGGGAATPHLCDLQGKRLTWASEPDEGAHLSVGQVKYVTGGGQISARQLHGRQFAFEPSHLLLLITNHRPRAGKDYALWKRLHLIEFTQKFVVDPQAPDEHKADELLEEKLRTEAPGILAWLVRGYLEYKRHGLKPPEAVKKSTEEYQAKEDVLQQFVNDCCVVDADAKTKASELYKAYQEWAQKGAMWRNTFGEQMAEKFTKKKESDGLYYHGVRVLVQSMQSYAVSCDKKPLVTASCNEKSMQKSAETAQTALTGDEREAF